MRPINLKPRIQKMWNALFGRSILYGLVLSLIAITAIGIGGMAVSVIVAERVQGSGSAINVAGSLRMQSHRMGSMVLSDAENKATDHNYLLAGIARFEASLTNKDLLQAMERQPDSDFALGYQVVVQTWHRTLKPTLLEASLIGADDPQLLGRHNALLLTIDNFVDDIDLMVSQLEADTELRIRRLRSVLGIVLGLTVLVMLAAIYIVRRSMLTPLSDLLNSATAIARGDFSARAHHLGEDELGQLGRAFNLMAEELSRNYQELEQRVAQKTEELTRSNQSLGLLYHAIANLHNAPLAPETYRVMLREIEHVLDIRSSMACLLPKHGGPATILASTMSGCPERGEAECLQCLSRQQVSTAWEYVEREEQQLLTIPLRDKDGIYGMLRLAMPARLATWQTRLLEALTRHIGVALGIAHKTEQDRLLALQEERSIIARELHDSIAQSLSYMKIQASLLQPVLADPTRRSEAETTLHDLREGITAAYRQLRELLATFRLKMEGDFRSLLAGAVDEYASRSGIKISLETFLTGCHLTPNQEIHSLQIIREALSNVVRHAHASKAWVRIRHTGNGEIEIRIEDNGVGINAPPASLHYGLGIMRERALGLRGQLSIENRPQGGAIVSLRFQASNTTLSENDVQQPQ